MKEKKEKEGEKTRDFRVAFRLDQEWQVSVEALRTR